MANPEMHLTLQKSEAAVAHCASRIFAAYIAQGVVTDSNQEDMIEKSVRAAMKLAYRTEQLVLSDDEPGR
ncbi:MAG: hypothetical protein RLY93_01075 [Sumerlaeia bacterium]